MKFSIRDLLLVTVIVARAAAWWVDHRRQAKQLTDYEELIDSRLGISTGILPTPSAAPIPPKK